MKVILVDLVLKQSQYEDLDYRMAELENLTSTYWGLVVVKKIQKRDFPDYNTYIGSWKLEEIRILAEELKVDILIIWNILKTSQIYKINDFFEKKKSKLRVWDRLDLILKIFDLHATSPEAKLQIELASIKHMWPRIFGMWMELSRQGWWIGTSGIWETNIEIMKRHLKEKEFKIIEKLKKYENVRSEHRKFRKRKNLQTVWIVGYTNAWKSMLMNSLTHKWVLVEDKLFATLGTSVGKLYLADESWGREVLINDTIWFIRDLPPELIRAFSSTLEDSIESDVLIHVIDSSDTRVWEKIQIVEDTLDRIWAKQIRIYVFNKIDLITKKRIAELKKEFKSLNPIFISAINKIGFDKLKERIKKELSKLNWSIFARNIG
jgi:GTPase